MAEKVQGGFGEGGDEVARAAAAAVAAAVGRDRAAGVLARHHGRELMALLGRGGGGHARGAAEMLVAACAEAGPTAEQVDPVLAALDLLLRRTRPTAPRSRRVAWHRARLLALLGLAHEAEHLEGRVAAARADRAAVPAAPGCLAAA